MDMLFGVQHKTHNQSIPEKSKRTITSNQHHRQQQRQKEMVVTMKKRRRRTMKVVYISDPVYITTTEADFKGCVQDLTGRHSNVADLFGPDDLPLPSVSYPVGKMSSAAPPPSPTTWTSSNSSGDCSQELVGGVDLPFGVGFDDEDHDDAFASYETLMRFSLYNEPPASCPLHPCNMELATMY